MHSDESNGSGCRLRLKRARCTCIATAWIVVCATKLALYRLQGEDMGIPSDTDEDNQEEEISSESGFGNVLGEPEYLAAVGWCALFGAGQCGVVRQAVPTAA